MSESTPIRKGASFPVVFGLISLDGTPNTGTTAPDVFLYVGDHLVAPANAITQITYDPAGDSHMWRFALSTTETDHEYVTVAVLADGCFPQSFTFYPVDKATLLTEIATEAWDTLLSVARATGSIGAKIKNWVLGTDSKVVLSSDAQTGVVIPTVTAVTDGVSLADNAVTAAKIGTSAITSGKIAADAIGASELAADAATEIADAVGAVVLGDGDTPVIYKVTDAAGVIVSGAFVQIYTDVSRATPGPRAYTNSSGLITFNLDLGSTYYPNVTRSGVTTEEDAFTVTG